jgi:hypothetical protein
MMKPTCPSNGIPEPGLVYVSVLGAWHRKLRRHRYNKRKGLVIHYVDRAGKRRFQGNSRLKGSQAYPLGFARAVPWIMFMCKGNIQFLFKSFMVNP